MSELRFNVVESAFYKKATTVEVPERRLLPITILLLRCWSRFVTTLINWS